MKLSNQGPGKPDKLSQNAQAQTGIPRVQSKYVLDKRGCKSPNAQTSWAALSREQQDKQSSFKENTRG